LTNPGGKSKRRGWNAEVTVGRRRTQGTVKKRLDHGEKTRAAKEKVIPLHDPLILEVLGEAYKDSGKQIELLLSVSPPSMYNNGPT